MNTFLKDKRRTLAFNQKLDYDECWRTSLKYSSQLNKNINNKDLNNLCASIYGQYINDLQSKGSPIKNKNYIQVWTTMMNTVDRGNHSRMAIKLLYQTSLQHSS